MDNDLARAVWWRANNSWTMSRWFRSWLLCPAVNTYGQLTGPLVSHRVEKRARRSHSSFGRGRMHARGDHLGHGGVRHAFPLASPLPHRYPSPLSASSASFHSFIPNGWQRNRVVRPDATTRLLYCAELRNVMLESCTHTVDHADNLPHINFCLE